MRAFFILSVIALVRADVGGYNYGSGSNSGSSYQSGGSLGLLGNVDSGTSSGGFSTGVGSSTGGASFNGASLGGGASYNGASLGSGAAFNGASLGSSAAFNGPSLGSGASYNNDLSNVQGFVAPQSYSAPAPVQTEFTKEFFTYTAPEQEFQQDRNANDVQSSLKKNLRVIFIKGPESNSVAHAAVNLAKSAVESKTAIYVLTKQNDVQDLANKLQVVNNQIASKPEVHFVKYRTPEDAAHAQQTIQRQYDSLEGTSHSHNGGVAQVLDFASKGPGFGGASVSGSGSSSGFNNAAPATSYLPSNKV